MKSKLRYLLIPLILLLFFSSSLFAQEEEWDNKIASASYGLNFTIFNYECEDWNEVNYDKSIFLPGIDLRHFNGIKVNKSGGFYYGYEIGLSINFQLSDYTHAYFDGSETLEYRISSIMIFSAFGLLKHGYRFQITDKFDCGFEIGLGVMGGGAEIYGTSYDGEDETSLNMGLSDEHVGPAFEISFETGYKVDIQTRFIMRFGIMAGNPFLQTNYGDQIPARIILRFGFTKSH